MHRPLRTSAPRPRTAAALTSRRIARLALAAALCGMLLVPAAAGAQPRAVIAFLPAIERSPLPENASQAQKDARKQLFERESTLNQLAQRPQLAIGFNGATQGAYSRVQALLDLTQGTRVSKAAYKPKEPPELGFVVSGDSGRILDWALAAKRARQRTGRHGARPARGLHPRRRRRTSESAGRASRGRSPPATAAGASRRCRSGPARSVGERVQRVLASRRLVVASLAAGPLGERALDQILAARRPRRARDRHEGAARPPRAAAAADGDRRPGQPPPQPHLRDDAAPVHRRRHRRAADRPPAPRHRDPRQGRGRADPRVG